MSSVRGITGADKLGGIIQNDLTTRLNHMLGSNGAHVQIATNDEIANQPSVTALEKLGYAPVKLFYGAAMIVGGLIVQLIPKKKVEVTITGVASVEKAQQMQGKDFETVELQSVRLTNDATGSLAFSSKTQETTFAGEPIVKEGGNITEGKQYPIPQLPTSTTENTIDYAKRHIPTYTSTTTTVISGSRVAAEGVSAVLSGTYDAVGSVITLGSEAISASYRFFKPAAPAATAEQPNNNNQAGPAKT